MFVTIIRTARISDLRRGHLTAGFVPQLRVGSFHIICALHAHSGSCPPESSCCTEAIIVFRPTLPRTTPCWVSLEVFWRAPEVSEGLFQKRASLAAELGALDAGIAAYRHALVPTKSAVVQVNGPRPTMKVIFDFPLLRPER
jgi:hypothetical protein